MQGEKPNVSFILAASPGVGNSARVLEHFRKMIQSATKTLNRTEKKKKGGKTRRIKRHQGKTPQYQYKAMCSSTYHGEGGEKGVSSRRAWANVLCGDSPRRTGRVRNRAGGGKSLKRGAVVEI